MTQHSPQPELASNKALDEIIAIAKTQQSPDKFTHDRLERLIKSSIQVDAAAGYSALGALEAISGNEQLMDDYHKNSIKLRNNSLMHRNYSGSLLHVGRIKEAAEQSRIAASLDSSDLESIKVAICNTAHSGEVTRAVSLVDTYKKLVPNEKDAYETLINAASIQNKNGISDEEIMSLVQIACDLLRSKNTFYVDHTIDADIDDDGFISLCLNLNLPNNEISTLNRQLFEKMINQVPDQSPQLSVRFARSIAA